MKRAITLLPVLLLVSCYPTRIVTVTPYSGSAEAYHTTVTVPRTNTVTTTTQVYAASHDISLDLDLQAVAAAFGQASNVREFEYLLNNSSYMITNLDLNRDGFVDYLRVVETLDGYNHLFVIQAVLGNNIYQDVATVVVENPHLASFHVEIIGAPFIYGPSFFIRPVFHAKPCIFAHLCMRDYHPWVSPWHWGNYPSCYRRPEPVYLSHYQAYVDTYMSNSRYCHRVEYPQTCHYSGYDAMTRDIQRNDYGAQHPERSFTTRTANAPKYGTSAVERSEQASRRQNTDRPSNAQDIRENQAGRTTSSQTVTGSSRTGSVSGSASSRPGNVSGSVSTRQENASGSASSRTGSAAGSTTVDSRVRSSGSSNTSTRTVSPSGNSTTVRRGSASGSTRSSGSSSTGSSTRSGSSSGSSTRSGSATNGNSTRSGSATTGSSTRSGSATTGSSTRSGSSSTGSAPARSGSTSGSSRNSGGTGSARR